MHLLTDPKIVLEINHEQQLRGSVKGKYSVKVMSTFGKKGSAEIECCLYYLEKFVSETYLPCFVDHRAKKALLSPEKRVLTDEGQVQQTCKESKRLVGAATQKYCRCNKPCATTPKRESPAICPLRMPYVRMVMHTCCSELFFGFGHNFATTRPTAIGEPV